MYHRIAAVTGDPWTLCVHPDRFAEHVEVLAQRNDVVPLRRLESTWRRNLRRGVAITFDDGYVDNLATAKPCLERRGLPATVFVVSGAVGTGRGFWWDDLDSVFLHRRSLPSQLELDIGGTTVAWHLRDDAAWTDDDEQRYRAWTMAAPPPTVRHQAYAAIWRALQPLGGDAQCAIVERLLEWAGPSADDARVARVLDREELVRLAAGGLIEIGAHTTSHPMLATLNRDRQRDELRRSRAAIEAIIGQSVTSLSYPFGSHNADTIAEVEAARFTLACATRPGAVSWRSARHQLPRYHVGDWSGDVFARHLDHWMGHQG